MISASQSSLFNFHSSTTICAHMARQSPYLFGKLDEANPKILNQFMAIFNYLELLLFFPMVILFYFRFRFKPTALLTNWPVIGMLPAVLQNCHRIHDFATDLLTKSGGTFDFRGPWFCNMDMVVTCDPANIHHVFSSNFSNYPKGPEFNKIFDILGDGIFNADFDLWELHRRTTHGFMSHAGFSRLLEGTVWGKVETGLIPVLDSFVENRVDVDLQDVFQRLTFDNICRLVLNYDPRSLSVGLPEIPCEKAFNDVIEALLYRHMLPETIWKAQKWMGIGMERKLAEAWKMFDEFIYPRVELGDTKDDYTLLAIFKKAYEDHNVGSSSGLKQFLRDTSLSLMFAGRDTTSTCLTWLFWLIAVNPSAETKIIEEIETQLDLKRGDKWRLITVEESRRLVYLHGALSESLRLFPPVALEHKASIQPDILPSGICLKKNCKLIFSFYSTGRMESIWGKDCLEFKPERWISKKGGVKHEPSYKFPAFNAGPRTCLGKDMAFVQMKMVAAAIIHRYKTKLVDEYEVSPRDSIILQAKHGVRVKLSKRNI